VGPVVPSPLQRELGVQVWRKPRHSGSDAERHAWNSKKAMAPWCTEVKTPKSLIDQLKQLVLLAVSPLTATYAHTTARQTADQILTSPQPVLAASSAVPGRETAVVLALHRPPRASPRLPMRSTVLNGINFVVFVPHDDAR